MTIKEYAEALKESKIAEDIALRAKREVQRKLDEDMKDKLKFN